MNRISFSPPSLIVGITLIFSPPVCLSAVGQNGIENGRSQPEPSVRSSRSDQLAQSAQSSGAGPSDRSDRPTARYDQIFENGSPSHMTLMVEAESAMRAQRFDRAMEFCRRGLDLDNDDLDFHRVYAEALEGKLHGQKSDPDPYLYRRCVEEWLTVLRSSVGEEKGLNLKGAGGIEDSFFGDEDRYILARKHLSGLTGALPHAWETNARYLKRVFAQKSVYGKISARAGSRSSSR